MAFFRSKKRQHRKMEDLLTSQYKGVSTFIYKHKYCSERLFPALTIDTYKRIFLKCRHDWKAFLEEHKSIPPINEWELDTGKKDTIRYTRCVFTNGVIGGNNHIIVYFYYTKCPNSIEEGKWSFEINSYQDIDIFISGIAHYDDIISLIDDLMYNLELNEKDEQIQHDQKIKSIYSTMQ